MTETRAATWTATPQQVEEVIAAVLPHAADDRHLPMITCINLELDGNRLLAAATDRYTLGVCWADLGDWQKDADPVEPISVRIFARDLQRLFAFLRVHRKETANWTLTADKLTVSVDDGSESTSVRTVDVEFPRWRKILTELMAKRTTDVIPSMRFNPAMVDHFTQTAKVLKEPAMTWHLGGAHTAPPIVQIGERFIGLLMPQRVDEAPQLDLTVIGIETPKELAA